MVDFYIVVKKFSLTSVAVLVDGFAIEAYYASLHF